MMTIKEWCIEIWHYITYPLCSRIGHKWVKLPEKRHGCSEQCTRCKVIRT